MNINYNNRSQKHTHPQNNNMPSNEEKQINAVYQHAKLCSWKYRKVDLALTETVKSHGASGLRNLPEHKFNPIFLKQSPRVPP